MISRRSLGKIEQIEEERASAEATMNRINAFSLVPLKPADVHVRGMLVVNDAVDYFFSRFTTAALETVSRLLPGNSVMVGHDQSRMPLARFFDARAIKLSPPDGAPEEGRGSGLWVSADFYWMRGITGADDLARNIDGGVVKEVSLRWSFSTPTCSVCRRDIRQCEHLPGEQYEGRLCYYDMDDVTDVKEASFVFKGGQRDTRVFRPSNTTTRAAEERHNAFGLSVILDEAGIEDEQQIEEFVRCYAGDHKRTVEKAEKFKKWQFGGRRSGEVKRFSRWKFSME
jgi:hypothetical protein